MVQLQLPWGAIGAVWLTSAVSIAHGQVTTQESASVIVFPKVVADGTWDTTIQIANGANRPTYAVCHYVDAQLTFPDQLPRPSNQPLWQEIDFPIALLRLQPTHWVVSRGRLADPADAFCTSTSPDCDAAGKEPGVVPPVPPGFVGELICIEVDASGAPWTGNGLRGQATLTHLGTGEVAKYPAIGSTGFQTNDANGRLCFGGEASPDCPLGAEYAACPRAWVVSHPSDFDDRSAGGAASTTRLTVVPCSQDFETQEPASVTLQLQLTNELEQVFSASTTVVCWADFDLTDVTPLFDREHVGGDWLHTRVRTSSSARGGVMLVQQTVRENTRLPSFTAVATTPHQDGSGTESDLIVVPEEGVR